MKTNVVSADQLTSEQLMAWSRLQRADDAVASPFFRPEFTQAVAEIHDNVEVAVLEEDGQSVGFIPFARTRRNVGKPVAGPMNDFQGAILRRGVTFSARQLVRECGLVAWYFDHLIASQDPFRPYQIVEVDSPYIDLSSGFEAYREERGRAGSCEIKTTLRKSRKVQRDQGPVRLDFHTADRQILAKLIEWQSDQCSRTKVANLFDHDWPVQLLEHLLARPSEEFSAVLSALYVDDHLAAIHLGMRSRRVLHWWITAYGPRFQKYSPGLILLVEIAKACESMGIDRIDLGKGDARYKTSLMSGATRVAEGSVDLRPVSAMLRQGWLRTRHWARSSRFRGPAHRVNRFLDSTVSRLGLG